MMCRSSVSISLWAAAGEMNRASACTALTDITGVLQLSLCTELRAVWGGPLCEPLTPAAFELASCNALSLCGLTQVLAPTSCQRRLVPLPLLLVNGIKCFVIVCTCGFEPFTGYSAREKTALFETRRSCFGPVMTGLAESRGRLWWSRRAVLQIKKHILHVEEYPRNDQTGF